MIIWGWGRQTSKDYGPTYPTTCPNCHNPAYWRLERRQTWFSLFFIPLIPYQWNHFLYCPVCSRGFELKGDQVDRAKQLNALAQNFLAGSLSETDYTAAVRSFSQFVLASGSPSGGQPEAPVLPSGMFAERDEPELDITLLDAYHGTERSVLLPGMHGATKRFDVKIPPGIRDGQRILIAADVSSGPVGDLYLRVRVQEHPSFRRQGDDVYADLPLTAREAVLGGEVTVPTLKGRVSLRIPREIEDGRVIRLAGQGMPRAGGGHGDMYVTVKDPGGSFGR